MLNLADTTRMLRAAGESTRLRLLALCAVREWSVTELAASVGQSEPRVSRHLKVLCDAGLLRRVRRGQWVCYSLASEGEAAWFVSTVLSRIDGSDVVRRRDAQRAATSARDLRPLTPRASRLGRAIAGFIHESAPTVPVERLLLIEPMHLELIDAAATVARRLVIVAGRAADREVLREHCDRRGIDCRLNAQLTIEGPAAQAAIVDLTGAKSADAVDAALHAVHRRLASAALFWVVLPYEFLEHSRGNVVAHPITELRRLLAAAGFSTEKLKPIDEDAHVLVAHARHRASTVSAA